MSVSGVSESDSSYQTFLRVTAVLGAFLGLALITTELSSAFPGSSSFVFLVLAADGLLVAIFGGGGSLVPFDVDWAKQALILC